MDEKKELLDRLLEEYKDLAVKNKKAVEFAQSEDFNKLGQLKRELILNQIAIQSVYLWILRTRMQTLYTPDNTEDEA